MPRCFTALLPALPLLVLCTASTTHADEAAILTDIQAFFETGNGVRREELARRIETDPDYDRTRLSHWLHQADLFKHLDPGRRQIRVPIDDGSALQVALRIPRGYDQRRPYPLLYCLHGTGGNADGIIAYVERLLGKRVERYLLAAPTGYRQVVIHSTTPPSDEHLAVLRAVRETVHVDGDRVFVIGYSRGGHAAWTLAVLHPDQFAGVVTVAGTLILHDYGNLFETFLPNIANTRVLACWGADDVMSADHVTPSEDGGIAGLNRQLCKLAKQSELPLIGFEDPDKGHVGVNPPPEELDRILAATRQACPRRVRQVFRLIYQSRAYWIEAHKWVGSWWDQNPLRLTFGPGENPDDPDVQREAFASAVRGRLGELRAEVDGQELKVYRKRVSELTVWIPDGLIDWDQPVLLNVNGRKAFNGKLQPNLFVCLSQAARTYDFDCLRWAGLRFKSGSKTRVVTGRTSFPTAPITPE